MTVIAYVDGASRGQGVRDSKGVPTKGQASIGVAIYRNNRLIGQYARGLGRRTNNESEYEAVIAALLMCWANPDLSDPLIYSDSQLVVKQVNGLWRCENEDLRPLLLSIHEIREVFRFRLEHVPRRIVREADTLAHLFLDKMKRLDSPTTLD